MLLFSPAFFMVVFSPKSMNETVFENFKRCLKLVFSSGVPKSEVMDFLRSSVQDGGRREATFGFWQTLPGWQSPGWHDIVRKGNLYKAFKMPLAYLFGGYRSKVSGFSKSWEAMMVGCRSLTCRHVCLRYRWILMNVDLNGFRFVGNANVCKHICMGSGSVHSYFAR